MNKKINWVVGSPIAHSMSPSLHNAVYQQLGINAVMQAREYTDAKRLIQDIRHESIGLTAVTMPLKEKVVEHLDQLSAAAEQIGLVNTIVNQNGQLIGHNTDLEGIEYALRNTELNSKNILIIGAGAVAKIMGHFLQKKTKNLVWLNRTAEKAEKLAKLYGGLLMKAEHKHFDLIINTTAIGMLNQPGLLINSNLINKNQTVFDVVYNPLETDLLKTAREKNAKTISGLDMFVVQALRQIEIYHEQKFISGKTIEAAKEQVIRGIEQ